MNAGRYQDAIREFISVLADYERVMGPHNNWTLHARRNLGEAYLEAGLVAEGVELLEAAAAGLSAIVGPDSRQVTNLRQAISEARDQQAGPGAVGRPGLDPGSADGTCSAAS